VLLSDGADHSDLIVVALEPYLICDPVGVPIWLWIVSPGRVGVEVIPRDDEKASALGVDCCAYGDVKPRLGDARFQIRLLDLESL